MPNHIHVGVFFGGRTPEHDVSIDTAKTVFPHIERNKYNPIPIYLSNDNIFYYTNGVIPRSATDLESLIPKSYKLINYPYNREFIFENKDKDQIALSIDIALPCFHGGIYEGGGFHNLCALFGIPCATSNSYASAYGLDKIVTKHILLANNIPTVDFLWFSKDDWEITHKDIIHTILDFAPFPLFVKPALGGSSIGISKVTSSKDLSFAINLTLEYDTKVLVEQGIDNIKEISIAIAKHKREYISSACEVSYTSSSFLTYNDKYNSLNNGGGNMKVEIPARIPSYVKNSVVNYALAAFKSLGCSGIARIDFAWEVSTSRLWVLELNTIPLHLSEYLWNVKKDSMSSILDLIIEDAFLTKCSEELLSIAIS